MGDAEFPEIDETVLKILEGVGDRPVRVQRELFELAQMVESYKVQRLWDVNSRIRASHAALVLMAQIVRYEEAAVSLYGELERQGFLVDSVQQLALPGRADERAVGPLLSAFERTDNIDLKRDILRAMSAKWASPSAVPRLFAALDAIRDSDEHADVLRAAIMGALIVHPISPWISEFVRVAQDEKYGVAQDFAIDGLGRLRKERPEVAAVIEGLLDSERSRVVLAAARVLQKWRVPGAVEAMESRLERERAQTYPDQEFSRELGKILRRARRDFLGDGPAALGEARVPTQGL